MNTEDTDGTEVPFLYFPVVSGSATNLVHSVFVKKETSATLRLCV